MPDTTLTSAELDELERLAKAATPGDLDTVNDPADEYGGKSVSDYYDCPCCQGTSTVDGVTYANFDGVAMGVQFFGIGNEHKNYEAFFRAANPATILRLITAARAGLAGAGEWQPIETAPRDGTWFLGWKEGRDIEDTVDVWQWDASVETDTGYGFWVNAADSNLDEHPTHWRPLPAPPAIRALPLTGVDNGK